MVEVMPALTLGICIIIAALVVGEYMRMVVDKLHFKGEGYQDEDLEDR